MLRPSPNHGTQRLPNDDDEDRHFLKKDLIKQNNPTKCKKKLTTILKNAEKMYCNKIMDDQKQNSSENKYSIQLNTPIIVEQNAPFQTVNIKN